MVVTGRFMKWLLAPAVASVKGQPTRSWTCPVHSFVSFDLVWSGLLDPTYAVGFLYLYAS